MLFWPEVIVSGIFIGENTELVANAIFCLTEYSFIK